MKRCNTEHLLFLILIMCISALGCSGGGGGSTSVVTPQGPQINPPEVTLYFGDEILLSVSGGEAPYTWSSTNLTVGKVDPDRISTDGRSAYFVANTKLPEETTDNMTATVIAMDANGRSAQATITMILNLLLVTPGQATIALDSLTTPSIRFSVTGGESPYYWTADKPYLADLYPNGDGSIVTVFPTQAGALNLTVTDSRNTQSPDGVTLTIVEEAPSITPSMITLSSETDAGAYTFLLSGGTQPYVLYTSDPNILDVPQIAQDATSADVTALQVGEADLILEDATGQKAVASVTVTDLQDTIAISPSLAVISPGDYVTFQALHGLSPYYWTNENPELGQLFTSGTGDRVADFYAGNDAGVASIVLEDSRQAQSVARVTIEDALRILPGLVTTQQGTAQALSFIVQGGVPPYSAFLSDYRFGTVTQPTLNTDRNQYEFTVTTSASAAAMTWQDIVEVYDVGGLKATLDVEVVAAN